MAHNLTLFLGAPQFLTPASDLSPETINEKITLTSRRIQKKGTECHGRHTNPT
jgi:hypothetical protein